MPFALCTCCLLFSLNYTPHPSGLFPTLYNLAAHSCLEVILHVYLYVSFGKEARQLLGKF